MTNQTPESVIAEVIEYHADTIGSHYDGCYKHHAPCLAVKLRDMLREPGVPDAATGESEKRAWAIASHLERDRELIKAERDAAVAAIERVRALAEQAQEVRQVRVEGAPSAVHAYAVLDVEEVLAALDGAPEPEEKP